MLLEGTGAGEKVQELPFRIQTDQSSPEEAEPGEKVQELPLRIQADQSSPEEAGGRYMEEVTGFPRACSWLPTLSLLTQRDKSGSRKDVRSTL